MTFLRRARARLRGAAMLALCRDRVLRGKMVTRRMQKSHRSDAECIVWATTTNKRESSMGSMMAIKTAPVESTLSDAEGVCRVVSGERALFEELMRRYNQRVYRTIRGILRNEQEVEDTMQQAYLLAYAHLGEFAGASSFSTWLTRIAINEAYACLRKLRRLSVVDEIPDSAEDIMRSPPETPEHRAAAQESMRLI